MLRIQLVFFAFVFLLCSSSNSFAELSYIDPVSNQSVLDQVVQKFHGKVKTWQNVIQGAAERLFWSLVLISMVWTFGMMLLRKADIGEFFAEFTRFIIFTGFFFWLLTNAVSGHNIAGTIISSMQQLGSSAASLSGGTSHSSIMDVGFMILNQAWSNFSILDPLDSFIGFIMSLAILVILAVIAVNMLLLLISSWVLLYAGIFLLGFGGARWTTDIAINYFKVVLGIGIQLFVMLLIVGIGSDLLASFHSKMSKNVLNYEELSVMLIFAIALWVLISKLPPLVSGIVTGSSIGSAGGIGGYSAGSFMPVVGATAGVAAGAVGMAGAGMAMGASALHNRLSNGETVDESVRRTIEAATKIDDTVKPWKPSQ
ncbi:type IV secretion system protein TrbL [Nitrosomonas aestuarii]|uniref:Type IV secretion system protein TrbL n=1 Tax=Nitrosomonas aestuarii TaxID=52441 RepID=A0A1I4HNQ7_9PROT|nr:P-type conjugative transfer protein TrbL [Nitrosomonas aestuarii]SFL43191.1 type IV secretion system protein TrbL [Nitrosomonas aestuarii]